VLALISAIVTFGFLPYYPLWALIIIALDVAVVWAVAAYGRDALNADRNERKRSSRCLDQVDASHVAPPAGGEHRWPRPRRWEWVAVGAGVPHGG
jgi:hypothetical protein